MKFIASATDPQKQAKQMDYVAYGPTALAAMSLLPADFAAELPSSPANLNQGIRNDAKFWAEHLEDLQARFQAWLSK